MNVTDPDISTIETSSGVLDLDFLRKFYPTNFYAFAKGVLGFDWLTPHVHLPVCHRLQDRSSRRKLFVLPRGWLKTTMCTIAYPIWRGAYDSNIRILLSQNNLENSRAKLSVIGDQWEKNQILRAMFPEVLPGRSEQWSATSKCLKRSGSFPEGTYDAIGVRGQPTSRHYNIIIEDDTVAPGFDELGNEMLAPTHEDIVKAISWHKLCYPLLTDMTKDEIIVVGTRWYEHDLISYIMEKQPEFEVITRSCRENENGESDPKGQITYPERFGEEQLREFENVMGPYFFSTLMLNHPVSSGDMVFKEDWIMEYEELPPRRSLMVWTTLDPATDPELSTSREEDIDYSVVITTGKDLVTGHIYVLDYFREKCNPGDHAQALFHHVRTYNPIAVGYEDVAYQRSLDYWLRELMRQDNRYFILEPVKRQGRKSKETHIMGLQPIFANRSIWIRPWMKALKHELLTFPRGRNDDLIDALAMHLQFWQTTDSISENNRRHPALDPSIGAGIEEIRNRKRGFASNGVIFEPASCASTFFLS